jgi:ArsR family transcriptional regulator
MSGSGNDDRLVRRASILSALAHPSRLLIVEQLEAGGLTVSELTALVGADISTVSRHISILRNAGIVACTPEGNRRRYTLRAACVLGFLDCVEEVIEEGSGSCSRSFATTRGDCG